MLALYQLWLDDLYPRAKFADGLAMIEKLGHSRRMQTMRRQWINEEKSQAQASGELGVQTTNQAMDASAQDETANRNGGEDVPERPGQNGPGDEPTLFISDDEQGRGDLEPSGDELDALMAEDEAQNQEGHAQSLVKPNRVQEAVGNAGEDDPFAAEMEVMAGMDW